MLAGVKRLILLVVLVVPGICGCASSPPAPDPERFTWVEGGIQRGDVARKTLALVFTGHEHTDGAEHIRRVLAEQGVPGSFFFTGDFYREPQMAPLIRGLIDDGHYLGAHSDRHLLYCTWEDRDELLVTREQFEADLLANYREMERFGIARADAAYFMPPYEWYNAAISRWTNEMGLVLIDFSRGTRSNADYTTPDMGDRYVPSQVIYDSILAHEEKDPHGLNGFLLLIHIGTAPERTDKFYDHLEPLITELRRRGYGFERVDALLGQRN